MSCTCDIFDGTKDPDCPEHSFDFDEVEAIKYFNKGKLPKRKEDIIVFAFRYALDRQTAASWIVIQELKEQWDKLDNDTQKQIIRDIDRIIYEDPYGEYHNADEWEKFLTEVK